MKEINDLKILSGEVISVYINKLEHKNQIIRYNQGHVKL